MTFEATELFFWKNDVLASNQCAISTVRYSGDLRCALLKLITKAKAGNHMVHVIGKETGQ